MYVKIHPRLVICHFAEAEYVHVCVNRHVYQNTPTPRKLPLCRSNDDGSPMLPPKRRGFFKGFNLNPEDGTTSEDDDTEDMSLFLENFFQDTMENLKFFFKRDKEELAHLDQL